MIGLSLITLIGVGIRLLMMVLIQQRRERMNRQINERLRTLIAAYRTLGGSFTGDLAVDPRHKRDFRIAADTPTTTSILEDANASDRARRIRDAIEAALSDIILLGTEEHVRLAEHAARELVAGQRVHTHDLVVSLRNFVRQALDLAPIPSDLSIPIQGPTRVQASGGKGKDGGAEKAGGGGGGNGGGGGMQGGGDMAMTGSHTADNQDSITPSGH